MSRVNTNDVVDLAEKLKKDFGAHDLLRLANLISSNSPVAKYTPLEFDEIIQRLQGEGGRRGFSEKSIEAARLVLVEGASIGEAAQQTVLSRQAVRQSMARIERRIAELPGGWVKIEAWFPREVAVDLEQISEHMKAQPGEAFNFNVTYAGSMKEVSDE